MLLSLRSLTYVVSHNQTVILLRGWSLSKMVICLSETKSYVDVRMYMQTAVEPLYEGHCLLSPLHRAVYKTTSILGAPLYRGQLDGPQWCQL